MTDANAVDLIVLLREAGDELLHAADLDALLDTILPQLARLIAFERANVMLLSDGKLCVVRRQGYEVKELERLVEWECLSPEMPPFRSMAAARRHILLSDLRGRSGMVYPSAALGIRAYLGAPLFAGEELIGFLNLESTRPHTFTTDDVEVLQTFAHLVSAAIRNAIYRRESERRQHELEQMNRMTTALNRLFYLDAILESGLEAALTITGMERGAVFIFDAQRNLLVLRAHRNLEPAVVDMLRQVPTDYGVSGRAFSERRIVVAKEIEDYHEKDAPILRFLTGTTVAIPLIVRESSIGVMTLNYSRHRPILTDDTLTTAQAIADQLAFAAQRGQLVKRLEDQLQSVRHLYEASSAFLAQTNRREVFFILLRALKEIVPHTVGVTSYHFGDEGWEREQIYPMTFITSCLTHISQKPKAQVYVSTEEQRLLDECRTTKRQIVVDREHEADLAGWRHFTSCRINQVVLLPIVVPQQGEVFAFDVVGLLRDTHTPPDSQTYALVWALIHQVGATLSRVHSYEVARAEQSRLRAILEASKDGIIFVDRKERVRYLNRQALYLCGLGDDLSAWERRPWQRYLDAVEAAGNGRLCDALRALQPREGEEAIGEEVHTRAGRRVSVASWYVEDRRGESGRLFVLGDVTEARETEQLREDLLHMLVHDLRNPLTLVINALQIQMTPELEELHGEALDLGYANAVRLLSMINAILDLTRLRSGHLQIHRQPTDLESLIRSQLEYLIPPGRTVNVSIDIVPEARFACADMPLMRRVFQNLLGNALKFIAHDTSGYVRIEGRRQGDEVMIAIFNNGEPISEELMPNLFQPYATGHLYSGGIGLGLAFCKMVIEAHGGRIWAENLDDRGEVVFRFTLPANLPDCGLVPAPGR